MCKYFFFDLDGTLLGSSRTLHPQTRQALCRLHEAGHRLFLCSGRSPAFLEGLLPEVPFDGVIGCAGGCIVVEGQTIFENNWDPALLRTVLSAFDRHRIVYALENRQGTWQSPGDWTFRAQNLARRADASPALRAALRREADSPSWKRLEDFDFAHMRVPKLSFHALEPASYEAVRPFLEQHFHVVYFNGPAGSVSGELIDPRCTKADGVRRTVEYFHGSMADTVGFGDSMNDYQMIGAVRTGVVSVYAPDALKAIAAHRFEDPDEGGIARALAALGFAAL